MRDLAIVLAVEFLLIAALLVIALDVHLHRRFEVVAGLNMWGYRGPVMPARQPRELRVEVVGGTLAFGWGVAADETFLTFTRQFLSSVLNPPGSVSTHVTAVSVAGLGIAPQNYSNRLRHFSYLRPDIVCIVPDRPAGGRLTEHRGMPERSIVHAATGYVPILPLVLYEKGQVSGARPLNAVFRSAGSWLQRIDSRSDGRPATTPSPDSYASAVLEAAAIARTLARGVVIVAPPYRAHERNGRYAALEEAVSRRFAHDANIRYIDPGERHEMDDERLWLDPADLSVAGHAKLAEIVGPTILDLVRR